MMCIKSCARYYCRSCIYVYLYNIFVHIYCIIYEFDVYRYNVVCIVYIIIIILNLCYAILYYIIFIVEISHWQVYICYPLPGETRRKFNRLALCFVIGSRHNHQKLKMFWPCGSEKQTKHRCRVVLLSIINFNF